MRPYGIWVAILLMTLYLVFVGGGWQGVYNPILRPVTMAIAAAALLAWILVAWRRPSWRPTTRLWPAIAAILGSMALSTAASRLPRQSVEYLGYAVMLAALYLLLVRILANPFLRARMAVLAVSMAAILGGAFAVANVAHWIDWWSLIGRLAVPPLRPLSESLTYGNPSAAMAIVVLFAASALAAIGLHSPTRRVASVGVGVFTAFAILVSGSRAGWLGVGLAGTLTAVLWLATGDHRAGVRRVVAGWWARPAGRAGVVGVTVAATGAAVVLGPAILRRVTEGGEDLRINFVVAAWRMFLDAPVLGTGPGTWVIQRIGYTIPPETDYYIPHAHNLYAQTFAELGIVGAVAGLILVAGLGRLLGRALRDEDPERRRWAWAAAFGVTYFAAHQLLDLYMGMPAILFAVALPVAWLDATSPSAASEPVSDEATGRRAPGPRLRGAAAMFGAAAVALSAAGLLVSEGAAVQHQQAVDAYNDGDWARADALAHLAYVSDPSWAAYRFTLGLTAAAVGDHQRSAEAFRSVAASDDLPEAWLDLAAEEAILGNRDAAHDALESAARLGLQRTAIAFGIGDLALRLGDTDLATRTVVNAISATPSLAADPWWQADPARVAIFPTVVDAAIEVADPSQGWEIALMAGDPERARSLASVASGGGAVATADIIDAWGGDDLALDRVLAICDGRPLDSTAFGWAARLLKQRGDFDGADRYLRAAYVTSSTAGIHGSEIRVSDSPKLGRTVAGGVAEFWGTYTYRRPTPWNPLVASLVQLELR